MSAAHVAVIVVAAGSGSRLGADAPKAFVPLGSGTVLETALRGIRAARMPAQLIVVAPADRLDAARGIAQLVYGDDASALVTVIAGGQERADSVVAGLGALGPAVDTVLIHDAARALTPPELFDSVAERVAELGCGVVPALPVVDTVKRVLPDGEITDTLDRTELTLAQTPQGFPRHELEASYALAGAAATGYTDDAAIVSAAGHRVVTTPGRDRAFKITHPHDLARAEALLAGSSRETRTGIGVDAHAFGQTPPLRLAGVLWPEHPELSGHSDGDAACHAIVDALLAAAGLGDIGTIFGVDDPAVEGYAGLAFIRDAVALVVADGWTVESVAVEIVANAPRIGGRRAELEQVLGEAVGAPVSVAGTSADGLGLTGEGRGIGAVASALLSR